VAVVVAVVVVVVVGEVDSFQCNRRIQDNCIRPMLQDCSRPRFLGQYRRRKRHHLGVPHSP